MKEKVLVTGANGLLGSHVVRELLKKDFAVRVLVRENSDLRAIMDLNIEYYIGQVTSENDVNEAVKGCVYVVHAAARTAQTPSDLKAFEKPNIQSTKYVIGACKELNVKRLVFVSSANCFGNGTLENTGTEKSPFLPWLKNSGYAYSKYLSQKLVLKEVNAGLDAVVVNPTFILGENDYKPSSGRIFRHVVNKRFVFYPPGGKNFVDAGMAARGIVSAMKKGKVGECYLLAGENHSYHNFFKLVKRIINQKALFIPIPKWVLLTAGYCGSLVEKVFKKSPQLTYTNARMLCLSNYFSANKACNELDFSIIGTANSAEKAINWLKANNYFS